MKKIFGKILLAACFVSSFFIGKLWIVVYKNKFWEISPFPFKEIGVLVILTLVVLVLWFLEEIFSQER